MKMLLILVGILAAGFWAFGKVKDSIGLGRAKESAKEITQSVNPSPPPAPSFFGGANSISNSIGSSVNSAFNSKELLPRATRRIKFNYRDLPAPETITQIQSLGLQVFTDSVTRTIFISGAPDIVEDVANNLMALDLVPNSCAVQTFAVYVSKKAVKGFDLVAAIGEAARVNDFSATVGGGSATIDLPLGNLSALLEFIADGETVEVVQRPHIRLIDRVPAVVEAIDEIPIPTTAVSQGIAQTSIEYRKVGLQLSVTPAFLSRDRVRLEILQQNGVIGRTVKIESNEIPVVQTQSVSSAVELSIGQTLVFGGVRSYRQGLKRGLLGSTETIEEGSLYVILSTYSDAPRAAVASPLLEFPATDWIPSPDLPIAPDSADWIDDGILPALPRFRLKPPHK